MIKTSIYTPTQQLDWVLQQLEISYRDSVPSPTVLFLATNKNWTSIDNLLRDKLVTRQQMIAQWKVSPFNEANTLWFLAQQKQWCLINKLLFQNLITLEQLAVNTCGCFVLDLFEEAPAELKQNLDGLYDRCFNEALSEKSYSGLEIVFNKVFTNLPFLTIARILNYLLSSTWKNMSFEAQIKCIFPYLQGTERQEKAQSFVRNLILNEIKKASNQEQLDKLKNLINISKEIKNLFTNVSSFIPQICKSFFADSKPFESLQQAVEHGCDNKIIDLNLYSSHESTSSP